MRIIKPFNLGLLTKPYVRDGRFWLSVGATCFFDFKRPDEPLTEQEMWAMIPGELPPGDGGGTLILQQPPHLADRARAETLMRFVSRGGTLVTPVPDAVLAGRLWGIEVPPLQYFQPPGLLSGDHDLLEGFEGMMLRDREIGFRSPGGAWAPLAVGEDHAPFLELPHGLGKVVLIAGHGDQWFSSSYLDRARQRMDRNRVLHSRVVLVGRLLRRWAGSGRSLTFQKKSLAATGFDSRILPTEVAMGLAVVVLMALVGWIGWPRCGGFVRERNEPAFAGHDLAAARLLAEDLQRAAKRRLGLAMDVTPGIVVEAVARACGMTRSAVRRVLLPASRRPVVRLELWEREYLELRRRLSK